MIHFLRTSIKRGGELQGAHKLVSHSAQIIVVVARLVNLVHLLNKTGKNEAGV